ncbi:MAG: hypothetical protein ACK421_12425, partial [Pseudanabaenaceae cyanobacterium]
SPFNPVANGNSNGGRDLSNSDYFGVTFRGVRFLGFRADKNDSNANGRDPSNSDHGIGINPNTVAAAMTSVDQPVLLPVLQLHAPANTNTSVSSRMPEFSPGSYNPNAANIQVCSMNGSLTDCPSSVLSGGSGSGGQWTMRATATTKAPGRMSDASANPSPVEVNIYFVAGNSPSRSTVRYRTSITARVPGFGVTRNTEVSTAEVTGGLPNFVRLLENWTGVTLKITGGFLQNTRSKIATGPFSQTAPYATTQTAALNYASDMQTLWINRFDNTRADQGLSSFRPFPASVTSESIPYYAPPVRLFGFDVGILTQSADLFSSRFSLPIDKPDEFFRETDLDDPYIKQLMCALETDDPVTDRTGVGVPPNRYRRTVLRGKDQPKGCDKVTGVAGYTPSGAVTINYE